MQRKQAKPPDDRDPPRRYMNKQEAVRHLIHAAVRLIVKQEDPFAIHLLIHSADQVIRDIAKRKKKELKFDWDIYIKDEYLDQFHALHKETTNFLKHGQGDVDGKLRVDNVAELNAMTLFLVIVNYNSLFNDISDHMRAFFIFTQIMTPQVIVSSISDNPAYLSNLKSLERLTPARFFECILQSSSQIAPNFNAETYQDLLDVQDFYNTPIVDLRTTRKK